MFYLIGLGLNETSLSIEALEICKKASLIYLEDYTAAIPYDINKIEKIIGKKIIKLQRNDVEKAEFIKDSSYKDVVLLVYGNALTATTHITLLMECTKNKIKYKVIHNASIFDAVAETGLQLYKFGKIASIPAWSDKYKPDSFVNIIKDNLSIDSHTLILVDIGLDCKTASGQLKDALSKARLDINEIIICSRLGTEEKKIILMNDELKDNIEEPFCFIIPSKMHFIEKEFMESFKNETKK